MRRGWKRWADDGFPTLTPEVKAKYKFDTRGTDKFERISWEESFSYIANGMKAIATRPASRCGGRATKGIPMHTYEQMIAIGLGVLVLLVILYLIWPNVVGCLAVVGAIQIYRVWKQPRGE